MAAAVELQAGEVPPGTTGAAARAPLWFVSFDCATKTFAFSLSRIDQEGVRDRLPSYRVRAQAAKEVLRRAAALLEAGHVEEAARLQEGVAAAAAALDVETRALIRIADGATVDLAPGRSDKSVSEVERVQAVALYVASRIRPAMAARIPADEGHCVIIEFQMGPNAPSRFVEAALIALFAGENVHIVGPSLKNMVALGPTGRYALFAEKYSTSYGANKAHAMHNFALMEAAVGTEIAPMRPPSLRGHVADSFMQVLGLLKFGKSAGVRVEDVPAPAKAGPAGRPAPGPPPAKAGPAGRPAPGPPPAKAGRKTGRPAPGPPHRAKPTPKARR